MGRKEPHITFSAYTGDDEFSEDFGPSRSRARSKPAVHETPPRPRRRLRFWLLCVLMVSVSGAAVRHYAAPVGEVLNVNLNLKLSLPDWQLPEMPAMDGPLFNRPIHTVRIESPVRRISEAEIRTVLARRLDEGFLRIDVRQVKAELEENPWVDQASVRRVWPDSLAVNVIEQQPIARWGETELLNAYAEKFTPPDMRVVESLPELRGPEDKALTMMRQYQQFSQMLSPSGLRIRKLSLSERGSWTLEVDNELRLELGREHLVERLQRFVVLYDRALYQKVDEISVIDLRYRNGMAVRNRETGTGEVASL